MVYKGYIIGHHASIVSVIHISHRTNGIASIYYEPAIILLFVQVVFPLF